MSRSRRIAGAVAEGAAFHVLFTAAGLAVLSGWARLCARRKHPAAR